MLGPGGQLLIDATALQHSLTVYSRVSNKRVDTIIFPVVDFPARLAYLIPPRLLEYLPM